MKRYAEYKDSGIEWIGEIPSEWDVKKLKFFAKICNGQDYKSVAIEEGGYPVMGSGGEFTRASTFMYDKPSVLLGRKGTIDKPLFIEHPFWTVDTMYYTKINENTAPKFLYYLSTTIYFDFYRYGSAVPSMTQDDLNNIYFTTPKTSEEQQKIVTHLDRKTAAIDTFIADKQKLVSLLQEKRSSIISEAVTKGLDKTAKMKDSGVEWIGAIPAKWSVEKLKFVGKAIIGLTYSPEDVVDTEDSGTLVFRSSNIQNGVATYDDNVYVNKRIPSNLVTQENDLLICSRNGSKALIGKNILLGKLDANKTFGAFMTVFRSPINKFVYYVFNSSMFEYLAGTFGTSTVNQLTTGNLNNMSAPIPPVSEQKTIVDYLDKKTSQIDSLISDINEQIEKLKEYRQAIISEVVTGKVAV